MRKAIFVVAVVFCLAGVASALPTLANGGTFYLNYTTGSGTSAGVSQVLRYVDVDSNWLATGTLGSKVVAIATTADTSLSGFGGNNMGSGTISSWSGPTQSAPHTAQILVEANKQLLAVSVANPTGIVLNAGDATYIAAERWAITVGTGFTPAGKSRGAFVWSPSTTKHQGVFTESTAGNNDLTHRETPEPGNIADTIYDPEPAWSTIKPGTVDSNPYSGTYKVDNVEVSGVAFLLYNSPYAGWAAYMKADKTGYITKTLSSPADASFAFGNAALKNMSIGAVGDTNGNGIPDFYYTTTTNAHIIHGEDITGDGDFSDPGETQDSGLSKTVLTADAKATMELVQGTDGKWAMVQFKSITSTNLSDAYLTISGLNSAGNYDGLDNNTTVDIVAHTETSFASPANSYGQPSIAFVQTTPEPATLMLVGTGVLGLAGIIRRRLIG